MRRSLGIIIPTHGRYGHLRALLRSIAEHWTDAIETVIVVDDSSRPESLVPEFQHINLRHIVLEHRSFISKSKNLGWKNSDTNFLYFIDDDNQIDDTTIIRLLDLISSTDQIGALMPAVLYKSRPDLVWVYSTPLSVKRTKHELVGRNLPRNHVLENRLLPTDALPNASIIRRKTLEDVGGFDEQLVVNSSMDLCLRMKAKNWKVFSFTGGFVYHDVEPPGRLGWWAIHGASDPERVRYEIRDWFIITHRLRPDNSHFFVLKAIIESRFVIPNILAYVVRGRSRRALIRSLVTGYLEGLRITMKNDPVRYPRTQN